MTNSFRKIDEKADPKDELWKSQSRYDSLFDQASDPIMITDPKGNFIDVNPCLCKLFGYAKEELLGSNISKLMDPAEIHNDPIRFDLLLSGQSILRERRMRDKNGVIIEVEANAKMLPEGSILAIARDITLRKQAEEKIKKSEMDFRMLIDQASDGIFISVSEGQIIDVNSYGCNLMGFSHAELLKMKIADLFYKEDFETNPLRYAEIREGLSVLTERKLKTRHGTVIVVESNSKMLSDGRVLSIMRNITERKVTERKLLESENRFRRIVERAPVAIGCYDDNMTSSIINQKFTEVTGYTLEEIPTTEIFMNTMFKDIRYRERIYTEWIVNKAERIEVQIETKDGKTKMVEATRAVAEDQTFVIAHDITQRKKAEEKLKKSEEDFRLLIEQASDGIFISISDGRIIDVNTYGCNLTGYAHPDLLKMMITDLFYAEDLEENPLKSDELLEGRPILAERRLKTRQGVMIEVETNSKMLSDGRVLSIVRDITERKIIERKLRESENKFRNIVERAPIAIGCYNDRRELLFINQKFTELSGYTPDELPTWDVFRHLVFRDEQYREKIYNDWTVNQAEWIEVQAQSKSGEIKMVEATRAVSDDLTYVVANDITERKKSEEKLRKSEQDFRLLVEQASDGILISTSDSSIIDVNLIACKRLGYTREMLLGMKLTDLFFERDIEMEPDRIRELSEGKTMLSERLMKKADGIPIEVEISSKMLSDGRILGIARDITTRKKADRILRRAYERINYHINNTPLAVIEWDSEFKVTQWSKRAEEIFGWTAEEAVGKTMNDQIVFSEDYEKVLKMLSALKSGKVGENPHKNRNYSKDHKILYCEWYNSLLKDEHGRVETILSLVRDVTEIRKAEEEIINSEEKYRQMFYKSPYPAWIYDMDTLRIMEVNDAALHKYGYEKKEFSELNLKDLVSEQEFPTLLEFITRRRNISRNKKKLWSHKKKNGDIMLVEIAFYPIDYFGKKAMQVQVNDMTEKIRLEKKLDQQQKLRQQHITEAVMRTQENERSEIGKELHDNINQMLAASKMFLGIALNKDEPQRNFLVKSRENISLAIEEIRKLSKTLITPHLREIGLKESIRELVTDFLLLKRLKVLVDMNNLDENVLNRDQKIAVYRIVQEQLNNILKYANASRVSIQLKNESGRIRLDIADDGDGFDPKAKRKGIGITNIISRAELYNGHVQIDSEPGKGCRLGVTLNVKS